VGTGAEHTLIRPYLFDFSTESRLLRLRHASASERAAPFRPLTP
jgi:hypothetical protein